MFNGIIDSKGDELLQARLKRVEEDVQDLSLPTREELAAEVYSRVNGALALGNRMSPLVPFAAGAPAIAGDIHANFTILNQDAVGITKQLLAMEQESAKLFNLFAASQNALRQQVREQVFMTTRKRYLETFINERQLDSSTASFDFGVGMASLPLVADVQLSGFTVEPGVMSSGQADATISYLTDGKVETSFVWAGAQVELIITFPEATVVNRLRLEMDDHQSLAVDLLSSSPDGVQIDDLLLDIPQSNRFIDGSSNKFSGDWVVDFDPRHVKQMRIVLSDRVGDERISLRGLSLHARRYRIVGQVQSKPIDFPELGIVTFQAEQSAAEALTSVSHQISFDGMSYASIHPGQQIDLGGKRFWYRALMERLESNFDQYAEPLSSPGQDPGISQLYQVNKVASFDVGGGVLERTINLDLFVKDPPDGSNRLIELRETPLPGTLHVYQDTMLLGVGEYSQAGRVLSFGGNDERPNLTIRYQTSIFATAGIVARREFYTPRLYQISFERAF